MCAGKCNCAKKMRLDKDDAEKKDVIAVKKENKDDDNASVSSTVAAGNEDISAENRPLPPEYPTSAKTEPEDLPPLLLPKPDGDWAEERKRTDRSASPAPEMGKEEERSAEKERQ